VDWRFQAYESNNKPIENVKSIILSGRYCIPVNTRNGSRRSNGRKRIAVFLLKIFFTNKKRIKRRAHKTPIMAALAANIPSKEYPTK
jgi:hypothetical protein